MLTIDNLTCGYGAVIAAAEVSFTVGKGEILAILGSNGAGKTSTIMAAMGHVRLSAGTIRLDDEDITGRPAQHRPFLGMSVVPEGRRLFNDLSVEDNLTVGGYSQSRAQARKLRERVYSLFPRLAERRSQTAGLMSGGEQQMLAIGRALMTSPKVLLVDELSLGLMPKMIDLCLETISRLKSEGLAIVLVEQNTDRALDIADQVVVLSSGRVVGAGTPADIRGTENFFGTYLGLDTADASGSSVPRAQ